MLRSSFSSLSNLNTYLSFFACNKAYASFRGVVELFGFHDSPDNRVQRRKRSRSILWVGSHPFDNAIFHGFAIFLVSGKERFEEQLRYMLSAFLNDREEFFEVFEDGFELFLFLNGCNVFFCEGTGFSRSDGYYLWFSYFLFLASDITSLLSKSFRNSRFIFGLS